MQGKDLRSKEQQTFVFSEGQYGDDKNPCIGYMIRDRRYKLLIRGSLEDGMLFDLQKDPFELHNVFFDPAYAEVLALMKARLIDRMLFSAAGKNHQDLSASQTENAEKTKRRAKEVKSFIRRQW